ncbi:hypothetical protein CDL15_Pgr014118 [Punica granatum]|uniref:Uncharacterized protein n=1 Tax=Punica granatum TaxID=22663 RepID=A0A218VVS8_PUNGR|nr:hypothetical protein CDL15_Pgr014118 [Punica granatum]PKI63772.1 hypothetical protein CRG98_015842 [Punica granatum]
MRGWRPRPLLLGHQRPPWVPATSMERSKSPIDIASPSRSPTSSVDIGDLSGGVRVVDWRPQPPNQPGTPSRSSRSIRGLGPPINDPNPSTEIVGILREYRQPRWRGLGSPIGGPNPRINRGLESEFSINLQARRLPTPPPRSPIPTEDASDLGGGVGIADCQPRPLLPFRFSFYE